MERWTIFVECVRTLSHVWTRPWMWHMLGGVEAPELEDVSVTCSATPPYAVTSASADWHQLCGFAEHEVVGKTLVLIQGPATKHSELTVVR